MKESERREKIDSLLRRANDLNGQSEYRKSIRLSNRAKMLAVADHHTFYDQIVTAEAYLLRSYAELRDVPRVEEKLKSVTTIANACHSHRTYAGVLATCAEVQTAYLKFDDAEDNILKVLRRLRDNDATDLEALALAVFGRIKHARHRFNEALFLYDEALSVTEHHSLDELMPEILISKCITLAAMGNYGDALKIIEGTEKQAKAKWDESFARRFLLRKVDIYRSVGDYDKAFRLSDALVKETPNDLDQKDFIKVIGAVLIAKGLHGVALDWYTEREEYVRDRAPELLSTVFHGFCTVYLALENYNAALEGIWKAVDAIAPNYVFHRDVLGTMLDQMSSCLRALHNEQHCERLSRIARELRELSFTGTDHAQSVDIVVKELNDELHQLLKHVRQEEVRVFAFRDVTVDLSTGQVYRKSIKPTNRLPRIQLQIFALLVANRGEPVSNNDLIKCYEERAEILEGNPRRAQYFIREIRKRLGSKDIIRTVRGSGYMIPTM